MSLSFTQDPTPPIILVMGVGGAGCNAVANMFQMGIHGVDFLICNTDSQVLGKNPVPKRLLIGQKLTGGLGCGANPERGKQAAQESTEEIRQVLQPPIRMAFLTAGLGGGTGTGALPIIAEMCQSLGLLTVAVVSLPFSFEGNKRKKNALQGLEELEDHVDSLVVVQNDNIRRIARPNMPQVEAFRTADQVLYRAVRGIAEVVTKPGYVNVDFADLKTIMEGGGYALLGMASHRGENRALMAVEEALCSPLLDDVDIRGATNLLVNITGAEVTLEETDLIMNRIHDALSNQDANIILGHVVDEQAGDELSLTLVATGIRPRLPQPPPSPHSPTAASAVKTPPPIGLELPLEKPTATPPTRQVTSPPEPIPSLEEKLKQLDNDPRALERARSTPAFQRHKPTTGWSSTPPPLSSTRIEPSAPEDNLALRRKNPRLYDNAD